MSEPTVLAEYSVRPAAVIVHDPVAVGALKVLLDAPAEQVQDDFLFREIPDVDQFSLQHGKFAEAVAAGTDRLVYLSSLVGHLPYFAAARTNPNLVFTRDAAITLPWAPHVYLPARMAKPIRRAEVPIMSAALEGLGLSSVQWGGDETMFLEGGDVIPFAREGKRCLLVGYGHRTTLRTVLRLRDAILPVLIDELIAVELGPCRMHLDDGIVPVAADVAVAHPDSLLSASHIDASGQCAINLLGLFGDLGITVVEVGLDQSVTQQGCNYLCMGDRTVIGYDMVRPVLHRLRECGISVTAVAGTELTKGRGGPRCMSRPVYGSLPAPRSALDMGRTTARW